MTYMTYFAYIFIIIIYVNENKAKQLKSTRISVLNFN